MKDFVYSLFGNNNSGVFVDSYFPASYIGGNNDLYIRCEGSCNRLSQVELHLENNKYRLKVQIYLYKLKNSTDELKLYKKLSYTMIKDPIYKFYIGTIDNEKYIVQEFTRTGLNSIDEAKKCINHYITSCTYRNQDLYDDIASECDSYDGCKMVKFFYYYTLLKFGTRYPLEDIEVNNYTKGELLRAIEAFEALNIDRKEMDDNLNGKYLSAFINNRPLY